MKARSWSHVGITVSDFNKAVDFWWNVFRCPLVGVADTPEVAFAGSLAWTCLAYLQDRLGARARRRRRRDLSFHPVVARRKGGVGADHTTHICLNVRGIHKWHDYLKAKGVQIVCPPEQAPRGHWIFFIKDFDGNLIEITDLGYMLRPWLAWSARRLALPPRPLPHG
jgi:glyoxylase I family protein